MRTCLHSGGWFRFSFAQRSNPDRAFCSAPMSLSSSRSAMFAASEGVPPPGRVERAGHRHRDRCAPEIRIGCSVVVLCGFLSTEISRMPEPVLPYWSCRGSTRLNIRQQIFREILFEANRLDGTAAGYTTGISSLFRSSSTRAMWYTNPFESPIGCLQIQLIVWNLGAQGRTSGQQKEGDQPSIGSVNSHLDPLKGRKVHDPAIRPEQQKMRKSAIFNHLQASNGWNSFIFWWDW